MLVEDENTLSGLSFLLILSTLSILSILSIFSILSILSILSKVVEILLEHQAAPDALGMYQLSALAWATSQGHQDTISAILR